jgi:hypothetical protein
MTCAGTAFAIAESDPGARRGAGGYASDRPHLAVANWSDTAATVRRNR